MLIWRGFTEDILKKTRPNPIDTNHQPDLWLRYSIYSSERWSDWAPVALSKISSSHRPMALCWWCTTRSTLATMGRRSEPHSHGSRLTPTILERFPLDFNHVGWLTLMISNDSGMITAISCSIPLSNQWRPPSPNALGHRPLDGIRFTLKSWLNGGLSFQTWSHRCWLMTTVQRFFFQIQETSSSRFVKGIEILLFDLCKKSGLDEWKIQCFRGLIRRIS